KRVGQQGLGFHSPRNHRVWQSWLPAGSVFVTTIGAMGNLQHPDPIRHLLASAKTIAVVGLSPNPLRASYGVSAYMQERGYKIIPVNPNIREALGEDSYPSLLEVPDKIDIVNVFR